ncbi:substrate-binding domain-containing protein [Paraburkholderia domus]|jgi:ABC-type sugar transport system, periplasmic component|uniref:substrate-binding domain-containing protein n=1 Tax=Paraburkholderia domus TaxID=2793075 RepID=UPI0019114146|nr:substrate-binding domain-containing protein [Paraburkholderia domus]MBK5065634.1 substrate-binding domain-containing protein [Burkholderia sp. R-70199]CAE6961509.1 Ribose import binding protein RbsB [Paraburkholderia domus]
MKPSKIALALAAAALLFGGMSTAWAAPDTIGLSQESLDHPWLATQRKQIDAACKAAGVRLLATDGQGNVATQIAGIEDMQSKGIKLLLVQAGKAEGLRQELESLKERGIPYMFVGKPIENAGAITMVSGDNRALGADAGQFIVDSLTQKNGKPKGNLVVLEGIPGDETSLNRVGGAVSVVKKYQDIKIVASQPGDYRRPKAYSVMQNILQAHPPGTLDIVFAANGEMALGAIQAIKESGRSKEIKVVGLDGQKEEFDAIRAGDEAATWLYPPAGTEGMAVALKVLKGEKVPPKVLLPTVRVTKDNVNLVQPAF